MSEYASWGVGVVESKAAPVSVEIDVNGRWDALALSEHLIAFHSFLVQHQDHRWVVHARTPGCHGEDLANALLTIDDWVAERGLESVSCRVGGRQHELGTHARSRKEQAMKRIVLGFPGEKR